MFLAQKKFRSECCIGCSWLRRNSEVSVVQDVPGAEETSEVSVVQDVRGSEKNSEVSVLQDVLGKKKKGKPKRAHIAHEEDWDSKALEEWECNLMRKSIQKRRLRKLSRLKRAGVYWVKRSPTKETIGTRNKKKRQHN